MIEQRARDQAQKFMSFVELENPSQSQIQQQLAALLQCERDDAAKDERQRVWDAARKDLLAAAHAIAGRRTDEFVRKVREEFDRIVPETAPVDLKSRGESMRDAARQSERIRGGQ